MDIRFGIFVLLLLCGAGVCSGRHMVVTKSSVKIAMISGFKGRNYQLPHAIRNNQVCQLCEKYLDQAVFYLAENKTQIEVIELLHESCSHLSSFAKECVTLVDYYAPIFFSEISAIDPDMFCRKMNLCEEIVSIARQVEEDRCDVCHQFMSQLIIKLKDPDMQLDVIELLLKACKSMDNYAAKCKKIVFEYGPIILSNAEELLEKTDFCEVLHACKNGVQLKADA